MTLKEVMDSQSIVVFGASSNPFKSGSMLIQVLKERGFSGELAGINPKGGEVFGVPLYSSVSEVPFKPDLAALHIAPRLIPAVLRECSAVGIKGVVISSEGFSESGEEGRQIQEEIRRILRETGMRGFGPNTLGVINTETSLTTSYFSDQNMLMPGTIGFVAQSGIFIGALLRMISSIENLKLSKGLGLGNKVDVDEVDTLEYLREDDQTRIIGMYLEDIRDGRRFLEEASLTVKQKPVLLLKSGKTQQGARAIASHTASLAGNNEILDGAMKQAGVIRLGGIEELVNNLMAFDWMPLPRGNRIALVTFSGAQSIMSIDIAMKENLALARFSEKANAHIGQVIANHYKAQNPIDIFPDMMNHGFEKTNLEIIKALMEDDGVDGIFLISFVIEGPKPYVPLVEYVRSHCKKPFFVSLMGSMDDVRTNMQYLQSQKIPCYAYPESAVRAFANMWRYASRVREA